MPYYKGVIDELRSGGYTEEACKVADRLAHRNEGSPNHRERTCDGRGCQINSFNEKAQSALASMEISNRALEGCCPDLQVRLELQAVRTSPNYSQSNGKLERWHKSLKSECIDAAVAGRCKTPDSTVCGPINYLRLHSAIGYVTPKDMLAGHQQEIQAERDRKLDAAKEQRKNRRQRAA